MLTKPCSKAFSLIELLLVLTVAAGLLLGGAKLFVIARNQARESMALEKINNIVDASFRWLAAGNRKNFCGAGGTGACNNPISNQNLINAGLLTQDQFYSPWDPKNSNNPILVRPMSSNSSMLEIVVPNVPMKTCSSLIKKLTNKAAQANCNNNRLTVGFAS